MKKHYCFTTLAVLAAIAAFTFSGCEEVQDPEEEVKVPVLTITTESPVSVSAAGDDVTIAYTVENTVEGATVSASASDADGAVSWIKDFDCGTAAAVTFTVVENKDTEVRTATVTVTYTYGSGETVSDDIELTQTGVAPAVPQINTADKEVSSAEQNVSTDEAVILNPVEGGVLSAEIRLPKPDIDPESPWLTVTVNDDNTVTLKVTANDTGEKREAQIYIAYTVPGEEEPIEGSFNFTQQAGYTLSFSDDTYEVPAAGIENDGVQAMIKPDYGFTASDFSYEFVGGEVDWITDVDITDMLGWLKFSVLPNDTQSERTARIEYILTIDGIEVSDVLTIVQEAGTGVISKPEIVISQLTGEGEYVISGDKNEYGMIPVEIKNPVSDGTLSASTGVSWLKNLRANPDNSFILYEVEENTGSERTADVIITYAYGENESVTETIVVRQGVNYVIELNSSSIDIPADGVEDYQVTFDILPYSPDLPGTVTVVSDETWCTVSPVSSTNDSFTFSATANDDTYERTAFVTITFTPDNGGKPVSEDVMINQDGKIQAGTGGDFTAGYGYAMIDSEAAGYDNFQAYLMQGATGGKYFYFDLYSSKSQDGKIPAGTYYYDPSGATDPDTFGAGSHYAMEFGGNPVSLDSGSVTVSYDASGNITIEADVTAEDGTSHHVTYSGEFEIW